MVVSVVPSSPPRALVGLRRTGDLRVVRLGPRGGVAKIRVRGWIPGGRPVALCPTSERGLLLALVNRAGGSEVEVILMDRGRARVLRRSQTHEWFAAVLPVPDGSHFCLPQNANRSGLIHLDRAHRVVWDRLPALRRALSDRFVPGTPGARPSWLCVLAFSTNTGFTAQELVADRVVPRSDTHNPISDIPVIGFWRAGRAFGVIDNGGREYSFVAGASTVSPIPGPPLGVSFAFAQAARGPYALLLGVDQVSLLRRTGPFAWGRVSSCRITLDDPNGSTALLEAQGSWGAVITNDGTAHLIRSSPSGKLSVFREIKRFVDESSVSYACCFYQR